MKLGGRIVVHALSLKYTNYGTCTFYGAQRTGGTEVPAQTADEGEYF